VLLVGYDLARSTDWRDQKGNTRIAAYCGGPTIFAAVEKLGLKLEKRKEAAEVFVVDRCERQLTQNRSGTDRPSRAPRAALTLEPPTHDFGVIKA
jgi:hypothetical protein